MDANPEPLTGHPAGTWRQITCGEREALVDTLGRSYHGFSPASGIGVHSTLTDMDGTYGQPYVLTVWGYRDGPPVLRDEKWPGSNRPCEHHVYDTDAAPDG